MQACLDAVNCEWLSALPSTRARVDALLEGAGHEGGYINGDLELPGGWIDSAILHGEIWDAIEYLAGYEADKPLADLLRTAWEPILAGGDRFDELGLIEEADGCFDASLAPASVARVAAAIEALDLAELAREINPDEEEDVCLPLGAGRCPWAASLPDCQPTTLSHAVLLWLDTRPAESPQPRG